MRLKADNSLKLTQLRMIKGAILSPKLNQWKALANYLELLRKYKGQMEEMFNLDKVIYRVKMEEESVKRQVQFIHQNIRRKMMHIIVLVQLEL